MSQEKKKKFFYKTLRTYEVHPANDAPVGNISVAVKIKHVLLCTLFNP